MNKIKRLLTTSLMITSLSLLPTAAFAQVVEVPSEETPPVVTTETDAKAAGVPNTGIAPRSHPASANGLVFIGGSALGAALGLGLIARRKKSFNQ